MPTEGAVVMAVEDTVGDRAAIQEDLAAGVLEDVPPDSLVYVVEASTAVVALVVEPAAPA